MATPSPAMFDLAIMYNELRDQVVTAENNLAYLERWMRIREDRNDTDNDKYREDNEECWRLMGVIYGLNHGIRAMDDMTQRYRNGLGLN